MSSEFSESNEGWAVDQELEQAKVEREEALAAYESEFPHGFAPEQEQQKTAPQPELPKEQIILNYVINLLTAASKRTEESEFSPIAFNYADLETLKGLIEILVNRNNNLTRDLINYTNIVNKDKDRIEKSIKSLKLSLDGAFNSFIGQVNEED